MIRLGLGCLIGYAICWFWREDPFLERHIPTYDEVSGDVVWR